MVEQNIIQTAESEDDPARAALITAKMNLEFFASVIKSGEPWTATCQREFDATRTAISKVLYPRSTEGD